VDEALEGIRSALLDGDGRLAAGFFADLGSAEDALLGHGWWLGIRTARSIGNMELLAKCAERYLAVVGTGSEALAKIGAPIPEVPKDVPVLEGRARRRFRGSGTRSGSSLHDRR
jgi:hypothetical protein